MTDDKNKYILSINGMSKSFGRNKVLKHISMNVKPGTIMGLMGENGAGKSTMMKCLFGTYQKDEGTIVLDGKEVNFSGPKDALENGVAMVHQELNQCLERSVVDNMFLGRYPKNSVGVIDEGRMKKETSDLFRKLGITVDLTQPMKKMSVSQRQMCEIAKAISYHSKVIVLDEPTSSLTAPEVEKLSVLRISSCFLLRSRSVFSDRSLCQSRLHVMHRFFSGFLPHIHRSASKALLLLPTK
jgi:methyl-galactoside transport system ATP-binding protein